MIKDLTIKHRGFVSYAETTSAASSTSACLSLWIIGEAWRGGCNFEDLADGYGAGLGTMGGDWSGIRDSSDEAEAEMLARAMDFLRGQTDALKAKVRRMAA